MPNSEDSTSPAGQSLHQAFEALVTTFDERGVRYAIIGGLVIMKLMAMRPQDEVDIQDLLAAYSGTLDIDFIRAELETFTEPDDPRRAKFDAWVRQANARG